MSPLLVFPLLGLLLIGLSYPLAARRVRPNRWYGLRVPATFADEKVWYEANAVAGRDMMRLGFLVTATAILLPYLAELRIEVYSGICAGMLGIGSLILTVRGWRLANRLLRERRDAGGG